MQSFTAQSLLTILTVAMACIVLIRRCWGLLKDPSQTSCGTGGCGSCSAGNGTGAMELVSLQIDMPPRDSLEATSSESKS